MPFSSGEFDTVSHQTYFYFLDVTWECFTVLEFLDHMETEYISFKM